jgi:hypothetical protein
LNHAVLHDPVKRRAIVGALLRQFDEVSGLIGRRLGVEIDDERAGRGLDNRLLGWRRRLEGLKGNDKRDQEVGGHHFTRRRFLADLNRFTADS